MYTRVSLSIHFPGPRYMFKCTSPGLNIGTKKWPGPRPSCPYSVRITRYVRINFVLIVNQTRGAGGLFIHTVPIMRPNC